ncbi:MAG: virulence-associated E family protein [Clostridiales bacterium]|nr:virulence-associated E family protein [Clostridiales bacterium]
MRKYTICTGNSRLADVWPASEVTFEELYERLKTPLRTSETAAQYKKMPKAERDEAKDKGGFMMGKLKGTRRKKEEVASRSGITLDGDKLKSDFMEWYQENHQYKTIFYTTHSHTPENPRGRIVIPTTRDMTPEEANAISRYLAAWIGINQIDPCSFKINQMMYWPTCPCDGEYICEAYDGEELDPDEFLKDYPNWHDVANLPRTPGENKAVEGNAKKQEDPLAKDGVVGDWCRAHSISDVMENELSDIYAPAAEDDRYDYIAGEGSAGVQVFDDKFVYSWHATDPAGGRLLNAFDLVRLHKFGDEQGKSFSEMAEYALKDEAVRAEALKRRQRQAISDFDAEEENDDWKNQLQYEKKTAMLKNNLHNIRLIMQHDTFMRNIVFNQLADGMEIKGEVPWKHPGKFWRDADDAQLICYVDDKYGTFSQRNYDIAVTKAVDDRSYHPIRKMFETLPVWDRVKRVETLLIDYLGAEDTRYVRSVTRKSLCAAYMRVYYPGIKFDTMIVLNGAQGIGKSTLIAALGMEWFSDSLALSDMNDKTAAEKLQGYWILEIGELAGMKKADIDKVKAFISRQDDKYRASFGRRVTPHPRQCIFFGTTNSENGYLRDITGNRRFWNVKVTGKGKYKPWDLTPDVIAQIWAEVAEIAKSGEKLYLDDDLEAYAKQEQASAMEQDEREGIIRDYLDMLLPENWNEMDLYRRREYIQDTDDPTRPNGTVKRMSVSNMEIWRECFGKPKAELRPTDSYAISAIMARIDGWDRSSHFERQPIYGKQRVYQRTS